MSGASPARLSRPGLGFAPGDALSIPGEEDGDALSILGEEELGSRMWTVDCAYRGLSIPGEEDGDALSILGEEELGCRTWTVDCAYRGTCCCCSPSGMNCG